MSSRFLKLKLSEAPFVMAPILACAVVILAATGAAAQTRIINPEPRPTPATRRHIATLRSSDSPQGSRVTITSDQSLIDYEAYRQADKFYLRIPAADVPRVEAIRGRGFAEVAAQRNTDSTLVSFRLRPGATAHVEQKGNRLDVIITLPSTSPTVIPANLEASARSPFRLTGGPGVAEPSANANVRSSNKTGANASKPGKATSGSSPNATPGPKTPAVAIQKAGPSPASTSANQISSASPSSAVRNTPPTFRQRVRYWILLAQLNPVPVGIGVAVLLLLIGLLMMQRRRAKATKRSRLRKSPKTSAVLAEAEASPVAVEPKPVEPLQTEAELADATATAAAVITKPSQPAPPATDAQHERVTRASEEVKTLMAGGDYDKSIIASDDRYTRQLVGAELLSALVGRNLQRRERARAAFMNHGYFDDATRDLRIAESPNERAAAARRLSFVHDREATPHLIAALEDSSPDVRRASVEALMDLRDPAAIAPLNSLMQTETDRRVPRSLIKHAVEACATSGSEPAASTVESPLPEPASTPISQTADTEREVIEI